MYMSNKSLRYHTCNLCACTILNVDSLSHTPDQVVNGDINTILFAHKAREPKWLSSFNLTGAIFSLRELWFPCSRVFVFTEKAFPNITIALL